MIVDDAQQTREVPVDPFDFFTGVASKIKGLGGNTPGHDHDYVFHTPYFEAAPGPSRFIIQFHGLTARIGALWLRVHMLPTEPGSRAVMVNSDRIQLNRLIQNGGRCEINFEGFVGMSFGLYAGIQGETDARADDVQVWFDRPLDPNEIPEVTADVRSTQFGNEELLPLAMMLSTRQPSFANPVTQIATTAQLRDPTYKRWRDRIGGSNDLLVEWRQAFILQALERYGILGAGAHGLGFNTGGSPLPAILTEAGASILTIEPSGETNVEDARGIARRQASLLSLPADLINFDFSWSEDAWSTFDSVDAAVAFVEAAMTTVRPRGVLIHTGGFRLDEIALTRTTVSRAEVERMLLILISRGHEVAQFRISSKNALVGTDGYGAVGLIVRKADSVLR